MPCRFCARAPGASASPYGSAAHRRTRRNVQGSRRGRGRGCRSPPARKGWRRASTSAAHTTMSRCSRPPHYARTRGCLKGTRKETWRPQGCRETKAFACRRSSHATVRVPSCSDLAGSCAWNCLRFYRWVARGMHVCLILAPEGKLVSKKGGEINAVDRSYVLTVLFALCQGS